MRIAAVIVIVAALMLPAAAKYDVNSAIDVPADAAARDSSGDARSNEKQKSAVEALFRDFGMFGIWAADCRLPATLDNPHVTVSAPADGPVQETNDAGPDYDANFYSVLSARRLSAQRLEVTVIFRPGAQGEERQKLVFALGDGTRRTMFNEVEGGDVRVRHGIVLLRGIKTPLLRKCG